jgi:hypothetical protein
VSLFIEDLALRNDFLQEAVPVRQSATEVFRRAYDQIQGKWRIERERQPDGLVDLVCCGHNDQNIHVAVGMWSAAGVGAEKNDPFRMELPGNLPRPTADGRKRDLAGTAFLQNVFHVLDSAS